MFSIYFPALSTSQWLGTSFLMNSASNSAIEPIIYFVADNLANCVNVSSTDAGNGRDLGTAVELNKYSWVQKEDKQDGIALQAVCLSPIYLNLLPYNLCYSWYKYSIWNNLYYMYKQYPYAVIYFETHFNTIKILSNIYHHIYDLRSGMQILKFPRCWRTSSALVSMRIRLMPSISYLCYVQRLQLFIYIHDMASREHTGI